MVMHHWSGPRAFTRYESWSTDPTIHGQYKSSKESVIKEVDRWEIPRHHVRVCSILGEGSFGQVWKCEAYNVMGKIYLLCLQKYLNIYYYVITVPRDIIYRRIRSERNR